MSRLKKKKKAPAKAKKVVVVKPAKKYASVFAAVMAEFAEAFESGKRDDGKVFYKLADKAPAWLLGDAGMGILRDVHGAVDGRLPCDWIYEHAMRVADTLGGYDLTSADKARDVSGEVCDGLVDVYTVELTAWLADDLRNLALCDEAAEELGAEGETDMVKRISLGQYLALSRIASAVIDAVETEADSREDA